MKAVRKASSEAVPIPAISGQPALAACGAARPAQPMSVLAEDFSLLIRSPRRMRIARNRIRVLS